MKKLSLLAVVFACFGLTACDNYATPEAAIATAYKALEKSDTDTYLASLTPEAQATLGSAAAQDALRSRVVDQKVRFGKIELLSRTPDVMNGDREKRVYSVMVLARPKVQKRGRFVEMMEVRVSCDALWTLTDQFERVDWPICRTDGRYPPESCRPDRDPTNADVYERRWMMTEDCRVAAIAE